MVLRLVALKHGAPASRDWKRKACSHVLTHVESEFIRWPKSGYAFGMLDMTCQPSLAEAMIHSGNVAIDVSLELAVVFNT